MTSRRWVAAALAAVVVGCGAIAVAVTRDGTNDDSRVLDASYPEGPLYVGEKLYYAEMGAGRVSVVVGDGKPRPFFAERGCGPTAIAPFGDGFLVLCHLGRRLVSVTADGRRIREWTADADGAALLDPNDAFADGDGGVYFSDPGVFSRQSTPQGRVMYLAADGTLRVVYSGLWYPNGVYVDKAHGRVLVSEHMNRRVLSFDLRPDHSLGAPVTFATPPAGPARYDQPYAEAGPDGLEVAPDGHLYVAIYGEGRVVCFRPDGTYRGDVRLPTRYSTNIAFAPDGRAATTGSFDNAHAPFPGEVRIHAPLAIATRTN